ncbi:MAG: hypothetical protein ACKOW3_05625 [Hyphomicrobium sp.]
MKKIIKRETDMIRALGKISKLSLVLSGLVFMLGIGQSQAGTGTIQIDLYKAGFIVGVSGGSGTLQYGGRSYQLVIGGVSLGATIGASKAELVGEVLNINQPTDIEGTYTALQAGVAVAGGTKSAQLQNSQGVILKVKGKQIGLEFSIDLSGMQVSLK